MRPTALEPILTETWADVSEFVAPPGSICISCVGATGRPAYRDIWDTANPSTRFLDIVAEDAVSFHIGLPNETRRVSLRSVEELGALWDDLGDTSLYVDITDLAFHVWAALIRSALSKGKDIRVVYVEPSSYAGRAQPIRGAVYDLSERVQGLSPLPGFASLPTVPARPSLFVPMLGFEGPRFRYLLEQVQPSTEDILPIIGMPGFRPEYPFFAYLGNRQVLSDTHAWINVRYADASCPFSVFYLLQELANEYPDRVLKLAPIGTRPHALGALLMKLVNSQRVEIVYDHPIRRVSASMGTNHTHVYYVGALMPQIS